MKRRMTDIADAIDPKALVDLADGLRLGVVIVHQDGLIAEVNAAATAVFRPETNIFDGIVDPPDLRSRWENLPVGGVDALRLAVVRNERRRWMETVMLRLSGDHSIFVFRDITIKLDAQEELLRERTFYHSLLGQFGVGLMLIDREMHVLWVNDVAGKMLAKEPEPGRDTCFKLMLDGGKPCADCPAVKVFETGEVARTEVRMNDPDTGERILHIVGAPVKDYLGHVEQVSLVIEDVTEKRSREDAYRQRLEKEVEHKTRDLEESNRRLKMLDNMKEEFLANITHELRTPLVSGIGYIELMLQGGAGPIPTEAREGLEISHKNLLRLVGLIEDLLTYTRLSAGREEIIREAVNIGRMLKDCTSDLTIRSVAQRDLRVALDVDDDLPKVWVDAEKLYRVITNLLANTEKFTGDTSRILVKAHRVGSEVEVSIEDNGPGIPPEEREHVFDHFHRGSAAVKGRRHGAGIGLSLVRQILEAHNSRIEIRDSELGGAAMVFRLPAAGSAGKSAARISDKPVTILIVDDDAEVSGLLRVTLEDVGYKVHTEASIDGAASCLDSITPDVIVLEIPPKSKQALDFLREVRSTLGVPVIGMCGACDPKMEERVKALGAVEVLCKPFAIAALTTIVGRVAKRKKG